METDVASQSSAVPLRRKFPGAVKYGPPSVSEKWQGPVSAPVRRMRYE